MKVTLVGLLAVLAIVIPSYVWHITAYTWQMLLAVLLKYTFGEKFAHHMYIAIIRFQDFLMHMFFILVCCSLELVLGTKVEYTIVDEAGQQHLDANYLNRSTGQPDLSKLLRSPSKGKAKIIIMNHHTRVDWMYLFLFVSRAHGLAPTLRIVLKESLKKIPVVGYGMELFRYLFLSRSWEKDQSYLRDMIQFYKDTNDTVSIFIFPEGTDLSKSNIEKSNAYAVKQGLPQFYHVLTPRTTGIVGLMEFVGEENVEEIIDLTLGYTYAGPGLRPDEPSLVNGNQPRAVHLLAQVFRYAKADPSVSTSVSVAPDEKEAFVQFIHDRFAVKEQLLSRFYQTNPVGFDTADVKAVVGEKYGVKSFDRSRTSSPFVNLVEQVGVIYFLYCLALFVPVLIYAATHITLCNLLFVAAQLALTFWLVNSHGGMQQLLILRKVKDNETYWARIQKKLNEGKKKKAKK
ncbi:acetyltransferase [Angomonas deanei]|nr:acetyltransferase [Angomonas deanei]|eukprot:EPY39125.1 acetyltransferase [Angomonas deanei]